VHAVSDEPTFGELQVAGEVDEEFAAQLEAAYGPDWRKLTKLAAIAISEAALDRADTGVANAYGEMLKSQERQKIGEAFIRLTEAGEPLDDALIGAVVKETYGDTASQYRMDLVLDVVADIKTRLTET
jgi:hypothetical protein